MSFLEYVSRRLRMIWWFIIGRGDEWPVAPEDGDPAQTAALILAVVVIAAVLVLAWKGFP